jgi:altronate hydrolase
MATIRLREAAIVLSPKDNVAVATRTLTRAIPRDAPILKYGHIIGFASADIRSGDHVHVHNVTVKAVQREYEFAKEGWKTETPPAVRREFLGYLRKDGRIGTRNYILVIASVNCSASVCRQIADRFRGEALRAYPTIDGVAAITHNGGCAIPEGGLDHLLLQRTLAGFARHPNVFGYVLVGLGCEVNQLGSLIQHQGLVLLGADDQSPRVVTIQEEGGFQRAVEAGVRAVEEMLAPANECRRCPRPLSDLVVGTECGGSDAYSGITANPALGAACDGIVRHGGTVILSETPEMYGAEHLLTRRARTQSVAKTLIERIEWWERHVSSRGAEINNNPTPGNILGGITTIYEKSLGAIMKGGTSVVNAVYQYAQPVEEKGLVIMDTPGYDPVSVTGMVAGGANVIVFTTGRGSVYGSVPTPCIKVATNTPIYQRLAPDMDVNAGAILEGQSVDELGNTIFERILRTASGEKTASEKQGVGEEEFAPWVVGPVL